MKVHWYVFLVFSFWAIDALSQDLRDYDYKMITDQNGLPSNEVYDIVEDQEGFMWFATDRGISRFNGVSHEIFDARKGIVGNAVYHLFKQRDTSIVCVNSEGVFYKIKQGKVTEVVPRDTLLKYIETIEFPFSFQQTKQGDVYIGTRKRSLIFNSKGQRISPGSRSKYRYNSLNIIDSREFNDVFCFFEKGDHKVPPPDVMITLNGKKIYDWHFPVYTHHRSFYPVVHDSNIVVPLDYYFLFIDKDQKVTCQPVESRVLSSYMTDSEIFMCTNNGLYVYEYQGNKIDFKYHLYEGLSISSVLKSRNGNVWVSTIENGIRYFDFSAPQLIYTAPDNENLSAFDYNSGVLELGTYRGRIRKGAKTFRETNELKIYSIQQLLGSSYYVSASHIYPSFEDFQSGNYVKSNEGERIAARKITELNSGHWLISHFFVMDIYDPISRKKTDSTRLPSKINDCEVLDDLIYVVLRNEILVYPVSNGHFNGFTRIKVEDVVQLFEYKDWICGITSDHKLFRITNRRKLEWIELPKTRDFTAITAAHASKDYIHIGTNKGVFSWSIDDSFHDYKLIGVEYIPNAFSVKINQDTLFIANKKNIYKKALNELQYELPHLKIGKIQVDATDYSNKETIHLTHEQKGITIYLEFTNYRPKQIEFRYIIRNLNNKYVYTSDPKISINSLPPGKYTIEVSATIDGVNFTDAEYIEVVVDVPFWRKWPFISGLCLLGAFMFLVIYRYRIRKLNEKHKAKEAITQLKSQALGSQLNPHMIFNVLNSIQGLVSEGEVEEANIYIALFSKFIRKSLNYVEVSRSPLSEEIVITTEYISIEKLRFGNELTITIEESDLNGKEIMVPPLIIQPIIENAIKHGLMPSKNKHKQIVISLSSADDHVRITIQDNGIGFKEDTAFGTGMKITSDRLKLYDERNSIEISNMDNLTTVQLKIYHDR